MHFQCIIIDHLTVYTLFSNPNRCCSCSPPGLVVISDMAQARYVLFACDPPRLNSEQIEESSLFPFDSKGCCVKTYRSVHVNHRSTDGKRNRECVTEFPMDREQVNSFNM